MAPGDPLAPYRRLVQLAESQCALAQQGELDELARVQAEWNATIDALPASGPRAAAPLIQRAQALIGQVESVLGDLGTDIQRELGQVGHRRAVGRAYGAGYGPARVIDTAA